MPKKTTEQFIIEANTTHNEKYDYSKTIYKKSNEKVIIKCNIHGFFEQRPSSHLRGKGCNKCSGNFHLLAV